VHCKGSTGTTTYTTPTCLLARHFMLYWNFARACLCRIFNTFSERQVVLLKLTTDSLREGHSGEFPRPSAPRYRKQD
jgi:hypothetical protein